MCIFLDSQLSFTGIESWASYIRRNQKVWKLSIELHNETIPRRSFRVCKEKLANTVPSPKTYCWASIWMKNAVVVLATVVWLDGWCRQWLWWRSMCSTFTRNERNVRHSTTSGQWPFTFVHFFVFIFLFFFFCFVLDALLSTRAVHVHIDNFRWRVPCLAYLFILEHIIASEVIFFSFMNTYCLAKIQSY